MAGECSLETEAKVARGAAAIYAASIFSLLLNTAYFVILTNYISVNEVGLVSLLNVLVIGTSTLATLALPLVGSGITATPPAVTRFLSQYIQSGEGSARKLYFLSVGICAAASSAAAVILSNPSVAASLAAPLSPKPFVYAALDSVAYSFAQLGVYSLVGAGRAPLAGKLLIASSALRYAVAGLLVFLGYAVSGVFIGFTIGDFVLAATSTPLAARMVLASKDAPFSVRQVAAYMASVMIAAFAGFGVTQVDKLLAFFQQGLSNLGVYNVATVGAAVASFAPTAVTNVLVPTLGSLRPDEGARRRELMRNYTRYIIFIAAPMGAGLAAVSPFLLQLFGREYLSAAPLLAVISVSVAFTSVGAVYSSDLLVGARCVEVDPGQAGGVDLPLRSCKYRPAGRARHSRPGSCAPVRAPRDYDRPGCDARPGDDHPRLLRPWSGRPRPRRPRISEVECGFRRHGCRGLRVPRRSDYGASPGERCDRSRLPCLDPLRVRPLPRPHEVPRRVRTE